MVKNWRPISERACRHFSEGNKKVAKWSKWLLCFTASQARSAIRAGRPLSGDSTLFFCASVPSKRAIIARRELEAGNSLYLGYLSGLAQHSVLNAKG